MRIEQIEQVITIASTGSISKAAHQLYISQPNLSLSIKNLENELHAQLFKRTSKGIELTKFGREFLAFAQPTFQQFQYLQEYCHSIHNKTPLTFHVSCQYLKFASSLFIRIYKKYRENQINFSFREEPLLDIIESVHTQRSEVGLFILSQSQKRMLLRMLKLKNLEYTTIAEERAAAILGPHNPLYDKKLAGVTMDMLRPFPYVAYFDDNYNLSFEQSGLGIDRPYNYIQVSDRASMNDFISQTDAYTLGIHSRNAYSNTEYYSNVRALPLTEPELLFELGWIKHKSHPLSAVAEEFINELEDIVMES